MKTSDLEPLADALIECRTKLRLTQEEMGEALGISRKTYHLFEGMIWLPPVREQAHFVKYLHALDPEAAQALVRVIGGTLEDYVIVRQPPGAPGKPLDAKTAKLAFDAAMYATAEELDLGPKELRPIAARLLGRLAESGITLAQAAEVAKSAETAKKSARS